MSAKPPASQIPEPRHAVPAAACVGVWIIDHRDVPDPTSAFQACAGGAERARADRFVFEADRHAYRIARYALRSVLAMHLGCTAADVELVREQDGRSRLAPGVGRSPSFSFSYTRGFTLIAVSEEAELGADIKAHLSAGLTGAGAATVLSPEELAAWVEESAGERALRLTERWAAKRAALKLLSTGRRISPRWLEIVPHALAGHRVRLDRQFARAAPVNVAMLDAVPGHCAAIASLVERLDVRIQRPTSSRLPGPAVIRQGRAAPPRETRASAAAGPERTPSR